MCLDILPTLESMVLAKSSKIALTLVSLCSSGATFITVERGIGIPDIGRIQKVMIGPTVSATPSQRPTAFCLDTSSQCQTKE